jgi:hypothetical protein
MNLSDLFATWQAWNARDVANQAARRAETDGRPDDAEDLRRGLAQDTIAPTAIEALAAQHELAEALTGWRWHTITAAREQGATWNDVAAATGTDPTAAQQDYLDRITAAEHAAAELDIPFHDAERYRAAAADDPDGMPNFGSSRRETGEETNAMTAREDDHRIEHISGPDSVQDGLVVGEIALPGGLPPDEDDDDDVPHWTDAFEIADRDGYVFFDSDTPGGFRALTPTERTELTEAVRAGTPSELARGDDAEAEATGGDGQAGPRVTEDGVPWAVGAKRGVARERRAVENADPPRALADSHPEDIDGLEPRLDDLRVQLTGYTWREGVDREAALADRREQLGRWYDDDHAGEQTDSSDDGEAVEDGDGGLPQCLIYPGDPRWSE